MRSLRSLLSLVILGAALAGAGEVRCQTLNPRPAPPPVGQSLPALDLSDGGAAAARIYRHPDTGEGAAVARTAVSHSFAQGDIVGSAGYLCGIGGIGPDTGGTQGGPSSLFGHQGTFLGATLGHPF